MNKALILHRLSLLAVEGNKYININNHWRYHSY